MSAANKILSRFAGIQVVKFRKLQRLKDAVAEHQNKIGALENNIAEHQNKIGALGNNIAEIKRAAEGEAFAHVSDDSLMSC